MTIQEFDLPARWRTLLLDNYSEAIHNLEVSWPDNQSLEVSYRDIESFDPDFALSIIEEPESNTQAANQALGLLLSELGSPRIVAFVRITELPPDSNRTVRQLRSEDLGLMISVNAIATKIGKVLPRTLFKNFSEFIPKLLIFLRFFLPHISKHGQYTFSHRVAN